MTTTGPTTSTSCAMSSISISPRVAGVRAGALGARLGEEGILLTFVAAFAALVAGTAAPYMLWGDSWLTFLGGREISQHGIPGIDTLTVLSHGRHWIDQQWLAQLLTYKLESTAGLGATLTIFALLVITPLVLACGLARRAASARNVTVFAVLACPAALCAVRAQAFSYFLFVPFFALLCAEARRPSRKVWLVLPLLVVWANLHGAVLVAAALVIVLGATEIHAGRRRRGLVLAVGAAASVLATPYGLALIGYYRSTAGNALFKRYILEWAPPTVPSGVGLPFFLTAGIAIVLVARRPRALSTFELGALGFTLAGALTAQRSIVWFSYAALLLLPKVLEQSWPQRALDARTARIYGVLALVSTVVLAATTAQAFATGSKRIRASFPAAAIQTVRSVLARDPHARVIGTEATSDWLLYELPELRGRIAFDGRWEVLAPGQFREVRNYLKQSGPDWQQLSRGYRLIVLDPSWNKGLDRYYTAHGLRVLYRGSRVVVFEQ